MIDRFSVNLVYKSLNKRDFLVMMKRKWPIYVLVAFIITFIESVVIWVGTEDLFNVIHVQGKMVWILHPVSRIFLWGITTICEIIAVGKIYFWPSTKLRSYMLILLTSYFAIDFIMPLALSLFTQEILSPFIFSILALIAIALVIMAWRQEKFISFLLIPSVIFMTIRAYIKWAVLLS